jgi:hypothetical protein
VCGAGGDAFGVDLGAEPDDVRGLGVGVGVDGVERFGPGGQRGAGVRVDPGAGVLVPDRGPVGGVRELVDGRPPDLVVGGGGDLPQHGPCDGAPDGEVGVRRQPLLWLDTAGVLDVPAHGAA